MLAPDGSAVPCHVERAALDALVGGRGQLAPVQQAPVFTARRPEIENVASRKYDSGRLTNGIACVSLHDFADAELVE